MLSLGSVELVMCGRVIQKSGPLRLAIVEGLDVSDSRLGNVPPRYNAAPSQELLVVRQNHKIRRALAEPNHVGIGAKTRRAAGSPSMPRLRASRGFPCSGTLTLSDAALCRSMASSIRRGENKDRTRRAVL